MKPTIARIFTADDAFFLSSNEPCNSKIDMYIKNNINSEVNLASHAHHVPHIGLPQIAPVTKVKTVKTAPSLQDANKITSYTFTCHISEMTADIKTTEYANKDIHALGTWTYIILKASPC